MKTLRKIIDFLNSRNGTRFLSVVVAVVVWHAIKTATSNPLPITDIPLIIQPPPGWSVVDSSAKSVNINFHGTRDDLRYLNRDAIKVSLDGRAHTATNPLTKVLGPADVNAPGNARIENIIPAEVTVRFDRIIKKQVPVRLETLNILPDGFALEKTVITPATVELTGLAYLLDNVDYISTTPIDLDGRSRSVNKRRSQLVLPETITGIKVDPATVTVDLTITEHFINTTFDGLTILPMLPIGHCPTIDLTPDIANVTVRGRPELMHKLAAEDLRLFVDLTALPANRKSGTLPIRAVLPSGVLLVSTDPDTVKISLKE